jgi:hypothetical protein
VLTGKTLWVFHMGEGGTGGVPELIEVTNPGSESRKLTLHKLPPGNIGASGALAAYKGGVIGTFVGASNVTVFHKPARGEMKIATAPSGAITSMGSIAPVGDRALGEEYNGVHFGWFDLASMRFDGAVQKIDGAVQQSTVADAFGGIVFFSDGTDQSAPLKLRARLATGAGAPFALPAVGKDNGAAASAAGGGGRAFVIYVSPGGMAPGAMFPSSPFVKIATINDAKGNGAIATLGPSGMVPETAIRRTSWGAMGAFTDSEGGATVAYVNEKGALIGGAAFIVSEKEERVRQPAIAAGDRDGFVVWNQIGTKALRAVSLSCK